MQKFAKNGNILPNSKRMHVHIANKYSCNIIEICEPQTLLEALK